MNHHMITDPCGGNAEETDRTAAVLLGDCHIAVDGNDAIDAGKTHVSHLLFGGEREDAVGDLCHGGFERRAEIPTQ